MTDKTPDKERPVLDVSQAKDMQLIALMNQVPDFIVTLPKEREAHSEIMKSLRSLASDAHPLFMTGKGFAYHWRLFGGGLLEINLQKATIELTSPSGFFFKFVTEADTKVIRVFGENENTFMCLQYDRQGSLMRADPGP